MSTEPASSRALGQKVEELAERFLASKGLVPVTRNFHAYRGELDLVMYDPDSRPACVVFIEVRYRANLAHGDGAASVTLQKQQRIIQAARRFLQIHARWRALPCRFDVVSATRGDGQVALRWIRRAFDAN